MLEKISKFLKPNAGTITETEHERVAGIREEHAKAFLFCVRDRKAARYWPPFPARSYGEATRQFTQIVNHADKQNMVYEFPSDFELCIVGSFDDSTGEITNRKVEAIEFGDSVKIR